MSNKYYDYLVLGAGPAGVQTGYFMDKNNRDYLILERNLNPGSFFNVFSKHRKLISINKVYSGYSNNSESLVKILMHNNHDIHFASYEEHIVTLQTCLSRVISSDSAMA